MTPDRRPGALAPVYGTASGNFEREDGRLIERVVAAYRVATAAALDLGASQWVMFGDMKADLGRTLASGNLGAATAILRNPGATKLFEGFDSSFAETPQHESFYTMPALDGLARFAEYVTAIPLDNPEAYPYRDLVVLDAETLLQKIEAKIGWQFSVPNPLPHERGIVTSRGILSRRVPHALYQAWRIKQLTAGIDHPRVVEIGAGLGRTAYYAHELGITDYTIVDLPLTGVSQGYFLGITLGADKVSLVGETDRSADQVKILAPSDFIGGSAQYDLVVNFDSMTEMDMGVAEAYFTEAASRSPQFLALNHESNDFRFCDVLDKHRSEFLWSTRNLCFMRRGYVEEYVRMR